MTKTKKRIVKKLDQIQTLLEKCGGPGGTPGPCPTGGNKPEGRNQKPTEPRKLIGDDDGPYEALVKVRKEVRKLIGGGSSSGGGSAFRQGETGKMVMTFKGGEKIHQDALKNLTKRFGRPETSEGLGSGRIWNSWNVEGKIKMHLAPADSFKNQIHLDAR